MERTVPDRGPPGLEGLEPEQGGLTATEVARRALAASAAVKQKRAQVEAANEKITQTMIQFFPRLTALAGYTRLSPVSSAFGGALVGAGNVGPLTTGPCPPPLAGTCVLDSGRAPVGAAAFTIPTVQDNWSVGARLSVPLSDYVLRLSDAAASSSASREATRLAVAAETLKVDADARALYFNWLRARGQAAIARKAVERTRARLTDARATFAVGVISKADLLRIEALVANTELVLNRAASFVLLTTGQLAIVMEDWHPNYRVGEAIPDPASIPDADAPLDRLIAEAQARRLEVHAMDETVRALRRGAAATRAGAMPRLDGVADLTYANPNQRYFPAQQSWHATWSAGLQASWTIDDAFSNSAAAREIEANAAAMEAQRTLLRAGVAQEVLVSFLDLSRARAGLQQQSIALEAAEEAYRVTVELFRAGRATSTDLIESESGLLDAKLGNVNARIDLALAAIALRHATARDVGAAPGARN
jgi:outer membrane protein TolC